MSVYLRGKTFWADVCIGDKRYRRSCNTSDFEKAKEIEENLFNLMRIECLNGVETREADNPLVAKLYHAAKRRAKINGVEFTLTKKDADYLFKRAGKRCELTKIPFDFSKNTRYTKRPFVPSIDRIDSRKGYTMNNCRVICLMANIAVNEWGEELFSKLAYAYVTFKPQKDFIRISNA